MSKAIEGAALLAGAVGMGVLVAMDPALLASPLFDKAWAALIVGGISMEAGAIASALTSNRGSNITTRQPAGNRQIIYGEQRVGGNMVYCSTTGGHHDQYNMVIAIAGHVCDSIVNLYLDGRQVYWRGTGPGYGTRNGVTFGGDADHNDHTGPNGLKYNFGDLVYCEARFGDQLPGDVISSLTANDPNWAAGASGSPYLGGCTYVYLKVEYDAAMFPTLPEIKFTVRGKNNVFDPRTGTTSYTNNWALIVADVLEDTEFGLGDVGSVDTTQLIAAANVCDEMVPLANGSEEKRYTLNWHYDTSTTPGDALQEMMKGAAGRLSRIGESWFIWPAYWTGPSISFGPGDMIGSWNWEPKRSLRDLFNVVTGTYIAPNYPYNDAGNLYDSNGWYNGTLQDNFPFAFQPTNFPQYAVDTLHGYSTNQYLEEDNGVTLPRELSLQTVLSVSQAQRVAKIMLLRNRQQGSGTFEMSLSAYQVQPIDVISFSFPNFGWTNKQLEVTGVTLKLDGDPPSFRVQIAVQETDESVYAWSPTEELTVYDVPASVSGAPYTPESPQNFSVISSAATAITGTDGIMRPRAELMWDAPLDSLVKLIQLQYQGPSGAWIDAGSVSADSTSAYIGNVVSGVAYTFQIRSLRSNGAVSPWVQAGPTTISQNTTSLVSAAMSPNSPYNIDNNATVDSIVQAGAATVRVYGPGGPTSAWTRYVGATTITMAAAQITGAAFSTTYYVAYDTISGNLVLLGNYNSTLNDSYVPVGSLETVTSTNTGGGAGGGGSTPGGGRTYAYPLPETK